MHFSAVVSDVESDVFLGALAIARSWPSMCPEKWWPSEFDSRKPDRSSISSTSTFAKIAIQVILPEGGNDIYTAVKQ
jgi:hypothetical protein